MVDYDKVMEIGSRFADWSYDQGSRALSKTYSLTGKALKMPSTKKPYESQIYSSSCTRF